MLKKIDAVLETIPPKFILMGMVFGTLSLGFIDYSLGPELSFSVFYLGPIMLAGWYAGSRAGLTIAFLSGLIWGIADLAVNPTYSSLYIPLWNTLVRLGFFLTILYLFLKIKDKLLLEASLADTDPLTGLANRRSFLEQLEREQIRINRYPEPLTLVYIDLDNFKYVNDSLGHDIGDNLLTIVANTIKENTRASDTIARLGGDEFALLFPFLEHDAAQKFLKDLQDNLLNTMNSNNWPVTFSIGAITFQENMPSVRESIKLVDDLMYKVKKSGKNNIKLLNWSAS